MTVEVIVKRCHFQTETRQWRHKAAQKEGKKETERKKERHVIVHVNGGSFAHDTEAVQNATIICS